MAGRFDEDKEFAQKALDRYLLSEVHSDRLILERLMRYRNHHCKDNNQNYDDFLIGYYNKFKAKRNLSDEDIQKIFKQTQ